VELPDQLSFGDFWQALAEQVERLDKGALAPEFAAFAARHGLEPSTPGLRRDFERLWLGFEATRDGGFWGLRWKVTDQEPSSVQIWKAWERDVPQPMFARATAVAECDEITALLSVTARHLGVRGVGLFYPTWNHVIAGWSPAGVSREGAPVVLVPTTQIFQACDATFDQTSFKAPKHVYEFPRYDVRDSTSMPGPLATFLLEQVRAYGEASPALLGLIRAKRAQLLQSSMGACVDYRQSVRERVGSHLSCADHRALQHLAGRELGSSMTDSAVLDFLAAP
jgi:hypothetical protein